VNTFSKECGSTYLKAAPKCCRNLICRNKKCTIPPKTPTFTPSKQMVCAVVNERSQECNSKGGKTKCCPGLVCHKNQSWRCVEEKNRKCAGPNTISKLCNAKWKNAALECCPGLTCKGKKCVKP